MRYEVIQPSALLQPYIRFFWILEGDVAPGEDFVYRSMADSGAELLFHYQGIFEEILPCGKRENSFTSGMQAQTRRMSRFAIQQSFGLFGVYLYPFTLSMLCGSPAAAFTGESPDLVALLGNEGRQLEEQMMLALSNSERVELITAFLEQKLSRAKAPDAGITGLIRRLIHDGARANVQQLAAQSFLSMRQFERTFKANAGFSPKLYQRILRFQEVLKHYPRGRKTLTGIAYDCGYADQSHFIHDFKEFSGHHPAAFFKGFADDVSAAELS